MTLALITLAAALSLGAEPKGGSLVDEVIAGADANLAKIDRGEASYRIKGKFAVAPTFKPGQQSSVPLKGDTFEFEARIWFDSKKSRWDEHETRCLRDETTNTTYTPPQAVIEPVHHVAMIDEIGKSIHTPLLYHPHCLGHSVSGAYGDLPISDYLRLYRERADCTIKAVDEGKTIVHVTVVEPKANYKSEFWVDRSKGYGLVRVKRWSINVPAIPHTEAETDYVEKGGAFVASRHTTRARKFVNGSYQDSLERTTTLLDIKLGKASPAKKFTLEDFGLPKGARVEDKRTGKGYLWGVKATTEGEIEDAIQHILIHGDRSPYLQSRSRWRYLWWYGLPAVGALSAAGGIVWWRRRRRQALV